MGNPYRELAASNLSMRRVWLKVLVLVGADIDHPRPPASTEALAGLAIFLVFRLVAHSSAIQMF
jgi:hypothetical protein